MGQESFGNAVADERWPFLLTGADRLLGFLRDLRGSRFICDADSGRARVRAFVYNSQPSRVVFRVGGLDELGEEIERLGAHRALVLCTPEQRASAEDVSKRLGERSAGVYDKTTTHLTPHTPETPRLGAIALHPHRPQ